MDFPDYNSFLQLESYFQEWPHCNACVMVGAGFSLNSKPLPGIQSRFPNWEQLACSMYKEFNPPPTNASDEELKEWKQEFQQNEPTRIAAIYEALCGREKLVSFLHQAIPDKDHEPGYLHDLLLGLPWREIFTTNYDTLLEQANVSANSYRVANFKEDLQYGGKARIVKLHGSLHSRTHLTITEKDYRVYPERAAPFVQLVQHSLTENAFVLLGFSGDDPNFKNWIGWIRNQYGDTHHPVFLVSLQSFSTQDRVYLKSQGVTPIDIRPFLYEETPFEEPHSVALERFLKRLSEQKPYRPAGWPILSSRTESDHSLIFTSEEAEPGTVESLLGHHNSFDEIVAIKVTKRWRYERARYPGWVVAPDESRSLLWRKTVPHARNFIKATQDCSPVDQALLYRELLWRFNISMIPIGIDLANTLETVVDELFPLLENSSNLQPSSRVKDILNVSDNEVLESWLEMALASLRNARESHDTERWNEIENKVSQFIHSCPQFQDEYCFEKAVWHLWNLDRDRAHTHVVKWTPSATSPLALMRKAGILLELDIWDEAHSLLYAALEEIRKPPYETRNKYIDRLSLEGWCTYLLMPIESFRNLYDSVQDPQNNEKGISPSELREKFLERWNELGYLNCDPWEITEHFDNVLAGSSPAPPTGKRVSTGFDPDDHRISHPMFQEPDTKWFPAYSYLRMLEQVAIPPSLLGDTLRNAAEWLSRFTNFWSPMLIIRAGDTAALKNGNIIDRTRVARMDSDFCHRLNNWSTSPLRHDPFPASSPVLLQSVQGQVLETLIEFSSRLSPRLNPLELQNLFEVALALHKRDEIKTHIKLNKSCVPWFKRLFDAADDQQLLGWLPDLIRFPLSKEPDADDFEYSPHPIITWPDPMMSLDWSRVGSIHGANPSLRSELHHEIDRLLQYASTSSGEVQERALMRLIWIFHTEVMKEEQKSKLGEILWREIDERKLPNLPNLTAFSFLHLPSPPSIDTDAKLKHHFLTSEPTMSVEMNQDSLSISLPGEDEDQTIREISRSTKPIVQLPTEAEGKIKWTLAEAFCVWEKVFEWWENDRRAIQHSNENPSFPRIFHNYARLTLERISMFLARVILPRMETASEEQWCNILSFLTETRQDNTFLTPALPYLLLHRPGEFEMVKNAVLNDLSSPDEKAVASAAQAVTHWAYLSEETDITDVPPEAVNDLMTRVIFRQPEGILHCLTQLTTLILHKGHLFECSQILLISASLIPWNNATNIPASEDNHYGFPEHDRPLLRSLLGQLASALSNWWCNYCPDRPEPAGISIWRELCASDPLPEVRRSFDND